MTLVAALLCIFEKKLAPLASDEMFGTVYSGRYAHPHPSYTHPCPSWAHTSPSYTHCRLSRVHSRLSRTPPPHSCTHYRLSCAYSRQSCTSPLPSCKHYRLSPYIPASLHASLLYTLSTAMYTRMSILDTLSTVVYTSCAPHPPLCAHSGLHFAQSYVQAADEKFSQQVQLAPDRTVRDRAKRE